MSHRYFDNHISNISNSIKLSKKIDFQKFVMYSSLMGILIIATNSMAIADESVLNQSFSNSVGENLEIVLRGHVEDFSWNKKVSSDGVIEISGIEFSVVNDDEITHTFEICTIVQGPLEIFTPSPDSPLACTTTEEIKSYEKLVGQTIKFPNRIKVSDLVDISIAIQEIS